ncbi:MAG: hypothetical protein JWM99_1771 [Verrucomicrobiales bacterium]|jgi:hypothetical protein|nr:hypothetical protein [Verrucomicrobiales bacterium]
MKMHRSKFIAGIATVAICLAAYQAWRCSQLRREIVTLKQEEAIAAGQIQQISRERDESASKMSALIHDNEYLNRNNLELQKLRNEVARFRNNSTHSGEKLASTKANEASKDGETPPDESEFTEEQKTALRDWREKIMTGNSVNDLDRLQDSLNRWNELFEDPATLEMKPVFKSLKIYLAQRIADLRQEQREILPR